MARMKKKDFDTARDETPERETTKRLRKINQRAHSPISQKSSSMERHQSTVQPVNRVCNMEIESNDALDGASDDELIMNLRNRLGKKEEETKEQAKAPASKPKVVNIDKPAETLFAKDLIYPLKGKTIVISGVFRCTDDRNKLKDALIGLGARVTGSVSNKTDMLLHGYELEDGRPSNESNKYKQAQTKGKVLMSEEELEQNLIKIKGVGLAQILSPENYSDYEQKPSLSKLNKPIEQKKNNQIEPETEIKDVPGSTKRSTCSLWVEKFAPTSSDDIIGNLALVKKLKAWLKETGSKTQKACLISGPPGIGKTTAAKLVAAECGFESVVQNASDVRNKASVGAMLSVLSGNYVINSNRNKKCVIIMDEVDGMSGDRGGIAELIKQIKSSKQPIICICNDRQSQKIRTLATHCLDIRFKAPSEKEILELVGKIISEEFGANIWRGLDKPTIISIITAAQGDIRQILNHIQFWIKNLEMDSAGKNASGKDSLTFNNPFEAAKLLLNTGMAQKKNLYDLKAMFFVDYNLIHLFVFENYATRVTKDTTLEQLDQALDSFRQGDAVERMIKENRDYQILNSLCYFSALRPSLLLKRRLEFLQFPLILAKFSSAKKKQRLMRELRNSFTKTANFLNDRGVLDYCALLSEVVADLMESNKFDQLYELLNNYDLTLFTMKENLEAFSQGNTQSKGLESVSVKSKGNFTKFYNDKIGLTKPKVSRTTKKTKETPSVVSRETGEEISEPEEDENIEEVLNEVFDI